MKLTMETIMLMNALDKVSGVDAKDCIENNGLVSYLVNENEVGKAIGKGATNVKMLESKLKKKVEIIPYGKKPESIITKTFEVELEKAEEKKGKLVLSITALNKKKIFSNSGRLKRVKELIKRNYELELIIA
jgi:NusA-like KH domain protein